MIKQKLVKDLVPKSWLDLSEINSIMTEVVIKNKSMLKTLDSYKDEFFARVDYKNPKYKMASKDYDRDCDPKYWSSDEHLKWKLSMQSTHTGFPEEHMACPMSNIVRQSPDFKDLETRIRDGFAREIGAHSAALLNYYPPTGSVGWHNNWNAAAYQILFTWSRTGDGYFKYYDTATKEVVTIPDVPGWQCRHYYFAGKDEPEEKHCWHAAYTDCDRLTLAYKFIGEAALALRGNLIEELESDE